MDGRGVRAAGARGVNRELLRRLAAEFAIVFVGVVLAFQFENLRETMRERDREEEALHALATDFAFNRDRLAETIEAQKRTVDALSIWLRASAGRPVDVGADSLGHLFPYAISWYAEELVSGAYDALIASGDIGLLRDQELRRRLAEFYGWVAAGFEDHADEMSRLAQITDLTKENMGPIVAPGGILASADSLALIDTVAVRSVLATPGLWGLLGWKSYLAHNRMARLEWLSAQADTISGMLPPR